jgi:putative endonuclease
LYSPGYDKYYIGFTDDYANRLIKHNQQQHFNTYTSKYRPWAFAAVYECGNDKGEAMKTENFIKRQKSRKFIEQLIADDFIPAGKLSHLIRIKDT